MADLGSERSPLGRGFRGPRVLGLGGGSPLAAPGQAAPLLCLSQLKFPFQAPPALHSPAPGRTLALQCSVPAALPSVNCSGLLPYPGRPFWLSSRCTQGRSAGLLRPRSRGAREAQGASPGDVPCPACAQRPVSSSANSPPAPILPSPSRLL
ncbi:hypothetical protein I79_004742 [Cricetulus griseus]|uniref:Uncharacterized protein n=1 Tax=Cricetulus griseus TaxID=10029 RepID=G3H3C7_CRIGR|nr:hypothetical protein I79_004742 [Cricetulus griseus]